jgi:drug/metabolite transporter (DMT)-like permease
MTFGATFTNIAFKMANSNGVTAVDYQIFRGLFICLFIIPFLFGFKKHPVNDVPTGRYPIVIARSLFATGNFIFYMWAMTLLPMYLAVILNNLSPFWASILGTLVNGD